MAKKKNRLVRVAMVKAEAALGDIKGNLTMLERLVRPLAGANVDVVITGEAFLDGYLVKEKLKSTPKKLAASSISGPKDPAVKRAGRLAKEVSSYLVLGASEKDQTGAIRNAAYLLDREGRHIGTYYKVLPSSYYVPGESLPVFETDFGTVGILICADRRWPENARCLRLSGAEIIFNPSLGMHGVYNAEWMRTRAYENGIPICFAHSLESLIVGANGRTLACLESNVPQVLIHDVDLSENVKMKKTDNAAGSKPIQNRRPELWGKILE